MPNNMFAKLNQYERLRLQVFAVTWLGYAAYYFNRKAFSVAKIGMESDGDLQVTKAMMGHLDALYLIAYAAGQFCFGVLADRIGSRRVILAGMLVSIGAALAMGAGTSFWVFVPAMLVQGVAQATGWPAFCRNVSSFFSVPERGRIMGLWCTSYTAGSLIATPFLGWVAYTLFDSWRLAFAASSLIVGLVWLLILLLQKNSPEQAGLPSVENYSGLGREEPMVGEGTADTPDKPSLKETIHYILSDRIILTYGAVYFLLKPARYAILFWGPFFVYEKFQASGKAIATLVPSGFELAGIAAPIIAGFVSDKLFGARRVPVCVISLLALVVCLLSFSSLTETGNLPLLALGFFLIGLTLYGPDAIISSTAALDTGKERYGATVVGFVNGLGSIGAILGGWIPGQLDMNQVFQLMAGANLIAAILLIPFWRR